MNDLLVTQDEKGGTATLTTASPLSHYGLPVLRIEAEDVSGDFGPSDCIAPGLTAAGVVAGWAKEEGRTPEELQAARRFLSQWPDGPQAG